MKMNTRKILEHSSKSIQMGLTFNMPHPPPEICSRLIQQKLLLSGSTPTQRWLR